MKKQNLKKENKGITLIALVITIIVLLILAGIAVASLTGENGIMGRTTQARAETALGEAKDEAALIATETVTDYYEDIYVKQNGTYDVSELDKKVVTSIKANESRIAKDEKVTLAVTGEGTGAEIKLTYTDSRLMSTAIGTVNDGKIIWDNISTADGGDNSDDTPATAAIIYPEGKTAATVEEGDTISIGEEQFMVLTNDGSTIMAIPYYNLMINEAEIKQATAETASSAGTITFSSSKYWTELGVNIDMNNSANKIQKYIEAYQDTLQRIVGSTVTAEVGRNYGDDRISRFNFKTNKDGKDLLNPTRTGIYWVGSSYSGYDTMIYNVTLWRWWALRNKRGGLV